MQLEARRMVGDLAADHTIPIAPTKPRVTAGKRVLILDFDLYATVGGGQSAYRRLIELFPENTYYYFIREEKPTQVRPPNTRTIPFQETCSGNGRDLPDEMTHFYYSYLHSWQLAAAVRLALGPCEFDVVDAPDYVTRGLFARSALEAHDIRVGVIALALHGTITSALRDEWPRATAPSRLLAEVRLREHLQYRSADVRYALSDTYATEWENYTGLPARPLDPLLMVGPIAPREAPKGGPPEILFIGRKERRKGPDLFVDLGWCLDPATYKQLTFIGAESSGRTGVSSASVLLRMAALRKMSFGSFESLTHAELNRRFSDRSLVVLPSRYDQFNLVALEALCLGCPAFISTRAGGADWILQRYPKLSDLVIDVGCSRSAAGAVRKALGDYDAFRRRIVDALLAGPSMYGDAEEARLIYEPNAPADKNARFTVAEIRQRFDSFNRPRGLGFLHRARRSAHKNLPHSVLAVMSSTKKALVLTRRAIRTYRPRRSRIKQRVGRMLLLSGYLHEDALVPIARAAGVDGTRSRLLTVDERTTRDISQKLTQISSELGNMRVARAQIFRDMARLERKRNGDLIAATYCLRVMRWLGRDAFGDLDFVVETFKEHKFRAEADVAHAMFADPQAAVERCRILLAEQYQRHLTKPDLPFEILDDRRGDRRPKVSVIVSLYNAEKKLETLLDNMRLQSLANAGLLELVLVDSGSPTNEYEVFKAYAASNALPILYARSKDRETIQAAWNRGIKLARGPYLSFLGCDEGLHPDALAHLSKALDDNKAVDWVMADSIVTDVDHNGVYAGDIMTYDRAGYDPNLVYLETCYLSWVGGLYRRSIHDRFGYYDETFRAAGDTEFKGRVLTHIKTLHLPKMLGVFNNYPEERTTQHPRAEIEDLRAWYLHRTLAGIRYSFDAHPASRAEDLFRRSLSYRKSFCGHISTDFDVAAAVGEYLQQRGESGSFGNAAAASGRALLDHVQMADQLDLQLSRRQRQVGITKALLAARRQEIDDAKTFGLPERPQYRLFNDNRHEQHWWSWST